MKWIKIEDQQPKWGQKFLAYRGKGSCKGMPLITDRYCDDITHWLPIPDAPKEEEEPIKEDLSKEVQETYTKTISEWQKEQFRKEKESP